MICHTHVPRFWDGLVLFRGFPSFIAFVECGSMIAPNLSKNILFVIGKCISYNSFWCKEVRATVKTTWRKSIQKELIASPH